MAPKKKPNAFMSFAMEWKTKYGKHLPVSDAVTEAGKIWEKMPSHERAEYSAKAKSAKLSFSNKSGGELTCTGIPIATIEKEKAAAESRETRMKRIIENTVNNSLRNDALETRPYFFIMVNYFTRTAKDGVYIPAELSVAKFSLQDGVVSKYHTLINPDINIYGHLYEAHSHSDKTHYLPIPPNALGETNMGLIYNSVLDFVRDEDGSIPPLYTDRNNISVVNSVMGFLKSDSASTQRALDVYSIQYLFFILKDATCRHAGLDKPQSSYITDAYFERDLFEFDTGLACDYHETKDRSKYCTQSYVTRWGFMFADYMCRDIAISLIPGRHIPSKTGVESATVVPYTSKVRNLSYNSQDTTLKSHGEWDGCMPSARYGFNALPSRQLMQKKYPNLGPEQATESDKQSKGFDDSFDEHCFNVYAQREPKPDISLFEPKE